MIGEVAAFNLVVLSGYVLSGLAMYFLARYLDCNRAEGQGRGIGGEFAAITFASHKRILDRKWRHNCSSRFASDS